MSNKQYLITYVDCLQGKTHGLVVWADSAAEATIKAERLMAWQQPRTIKVSEYVTSEKVN
jgi:hypothetical protein